MRSVQCGPQRALFSMAGLLSAVLLCLLASAAGLGALLKTMPQLFNLLRIAGALYLIYLGYKAWISPVVDTEEGTALAPVMSPARLYRSGLLTGLSNPKLIVFAAALFPQFIDASAPFALQLAILVGSFVAIECLWYAVYASGGVRLAHWLRPTNRQRMFNRATGAMFAAFGGLLMIRSA
jgi:threonine/homoserine/homoserine lactone efflux protein